MLAELGSERRSIVTIGRRTTTKTRVLARSQQVVRFDEEEDPTSRRRSREAARCYAQSDR